MTGVTGEATFEHDVAVSYAGEDRAVVEQVVRQLDEYRVFYDQDRLAEMWGENGVDFLEAIYSRQARYAVLFVSRHYVAKKWPTLERRAAQARALQQEAPYILPVKLDDTELPGMPSTTIYLDLRDIGVDGLVTMLRTKLGGTAAPALQLADYRVPRSAEAITKLLADRPPGWPYLLYGAVVLQGIEAIEDRYRDHQLGYAPRSRTFLNDADAYKHLQGALGVLPSLIDAFNRVLDIDAQAAAMGRAGEADQPNLLPDADRTIHLARRFVSVYNEFLDWAADLRSLNIADDNLRAAADFQARWVDQPIDAIRSFANDYVGELDTLVNRLLAGEYVYLQFKITAELPEAVTEGRRAAVARWLSSSE